MAKLRVGIIFGGTSEEHEVSIQSAKSIVNAIDKNRFESVLLSIDKLGKWHLNDIREYSFNTNLSKSKPIPFETNIATHNRDRNKDQLMNTQSALALAQIDVAFPIVHGTLGEDGSLQGMLKIANLPFVGTDVLGSAICMDKDVTKRLLRDAGLKVAPFVTINRTNYNMYSFVSLSIHLGLPFFIKPANQGSSIGVSKVYNETQFTDALHLAFKFDYKIIAETNIIGREIECAILGNDIPKASTCGEVILNNDFYSYNNKYINVDCAQIIIPAMIEPKINDMIREIAITAYQTLGCLGMARVDVFLTPKNEIIVNEINTLPGFSNISMYPKLWQASGLSYSSLISQLIELALEKHTSYFTLKT